MIKEYIIEADNEDNAKLRVVLNLEEKKKEVLKGKSEIIEMNDFFEIHKVRLPYEIKLVLINREHAAKYKIIESIAISPDKAVLEQMIVEFNTALKREGIDFKSVKDTNNY